jgi:hypothetical protein
MNRLARSTITAALLIIIPLTGIPASYSAEKSAEYKAALAQMRVTKDDFKETAYYEDKSSPRYTNANGFYIYVGTKKGSSPTLFLRIQYYGEDWLFIEKYLFKVDGYTNEIDPSYGDVETDNDSKVWEWYNEPVTKPQLDLIKKIATSKKAVMRIEGSKYYKDVTISSAQKKAISRVLTLYTGLGGK